MGLFDFLGGNKNKGPQSTEAFFLSEDEAKTFGNIDFMRKEVVVRRTFARKKGQTEELESVKSISSNKSREVGEPSKATTASFSSFSAPAAPAAPAPAAPAPAAEASAETAAAAPAAEAPAVPAEPVVKRTPDTSMDMFRNMAKNIRR